MFNYYSGAFKLILLFLSTVVIYHNNITNVVSLIKRCKQGYKFDKGCCVALWTQWCEYISPLRTRSWREGWTHKVSPCLGAPSANVHWVSFPSTFRFTESISENTYLWASCLTRQLIQNIQKPVVVILFVLLQHLV